MNDLKCKYCDKCCKNKNSLAQHEIRCKNNPNRIHISNNLLKYNQSKHKGVNQYTKAKKIYLSGQI